jgi:hypothetical protein
MLCDDPTNEVMCIIKALGGPKATAKRIGVTHQATYGWAIDNYIPPLSAIKLAYALKRENSHVTQDDLFWHVDDPYLARVREESKVFAPLRKKRAC